MEENQPVVIRTTFTKSNFCRAIRVDGAWGGATPSFGLYMALFSEHWMLPGGTEIRPDPQAGGVVKDFPIDVTPVVQREVEVDVLLTEQAAVFLRDWLTEKIADLQAQTRGLRPQSSEEAQA